jgi:hypothetical protein
MSREQIDVTIKDGVVMVTTDASKATPNTLKRMEKFYRAFEEAFERTYRGESREGQHRMDDAQKTNKSYSFIDPALGLRKAQVEIIDLDPFVGVNGFRYDRRPCYGCTITGPGGNWRDGEGWR